MGIEEKLRKEKVVLGKFDVHIKIYYMDGQEEEIDAKSWNHVANFLALDQENGMTVICLNNVFKFEVTPQESKAKLIT